MPVHQACRNDDIKILKILLEHDIDINIQDNDGWTPLHYACCCSHFDIIEELLNMDASITIKTRHNESVFDLSDKLVVKFIKF